MASAKSMADIAYDILSKKKRSVHFGRLWEEVAKIYGASNDHIGRFYSDLTLDSRFVSLKGNKWDLAERRKFNESHIDISKFELGDDEPEGEIENEEEDFGDMLMEKEDY